jgi:hypothetical protein
VVLDLEPTVAGLQEEEALGMVDLLLSFFKPNGTFELQEVARALECFWFSAALLPGLEEPTG